MLKLLFLFTHIGLKNAVYKGIAIFIHWEVIVFDGILLFWKLCWTFINHSLLIHILIRYHNPLISLSRTRSFLLHLYRCSSFQVRHVYSLSLKLLLLWIGNLFGVTTYSVAEKLLVILGHSRSFIRDAAVWNSCIGNVDGMICASIITYEAWLFWNVTVQYALRCHLLMNLCLNYRSVFTAFIADEFSIISAIGFLLNLFSHDCLRLSVFLDKPFL